MAEPDERRRGALRASPSRRAAREARAAARGRDRPVPARVRGAERDRRRARRPRRPRRRRGDRRRLPGRRPDRRPPRPRQGRVHRPRRRQRPDPAPLSRRRRSASASTSCSPASTSATSSASRESPSRPAAGELSLRVGGWTLLAKSLRPPPDKFHGLEDTELRYRHRELDLIANPETRELFRSAAERRSPRCASCLDARRLHRGRDAGPAAALRRRARPPLRHPPQRARPRPLPADRDRALPQAPDRRRHRPRLRARQGLPQRGRLLQAQPRVHDARVVRGLRRLRRRRPSGSRRWSPRSPSGRSARPRSSATGSRSTWRRRGGG